MRHEPLFTWLVDHPEVCGSVFKETRYFLDPGHPLLDPRSNYHEHGMAGYASHFRDCDGASARLILEATPHYLYQQTALEMLSEFDPLRRPCLPAAEALGAHVFRVPVCA